MPKYDLTEEGKLYAEKGLPEVLLVRTLTSPLPMADAQKRVANFRVAFQWAKKRGWVKVEHGKLVRVKGPEKLPEEAGLKAMLRGQEPAPKMLAILLKRKLVRKEQKELKKAKTFSGKEITTLRPELIKTGMWRDVRFKPYNVEAMSTVVHPGKRQPYNQFLGQVRRKLIELGFREMSGPLVETEFWNFDALYQPQNHPSRDWTQTYSLKYPKQGSLPPKQVVDRVKAAHENGWRTGSAGWGYKWDEKKAAKLMPRAHTTACSARQLAKGVDVPGKYFIIGRNYRPDVIDATHGVEFNHCEGIVIDPSLSFRDLLGLLKMFAMEIAGAEKVRFFPDYYPFTEPSVQLSAKHPQMGWIELAGAGMFRPELTEPLGVKEPVIAWGLGIDRLGMFKLGINDIRELFSRKLDWLRSQKVI